MQQQIIESAIEFPEIITKMKLIDERLNEAQKREKTISQMILNSCKIMSPEMKAALLSRLSLTKRVFTSDGMTCWREPKERMKRRWRKSRRYGSTNQFINLLSGMIHYYFFKFLDVCFIAHKEVGEEYKRTYHRNVKDMLRKQNMFVNNYTIDDLGYSGEPQIGEFHNNVANSQRDNLNLREVYSSCLSSVENLVLFPNLQDTPILFEENYFKEDPSKTAELIQREWKLIPNKVSSDLPPPEPSPGLSDRIPKEGEEKEQEKTIVEEEMQEKVPKAPESKIDGEPEDNKTIPSEIESPGLSRSPNLEANVHKAEVVIRSDHKKGRLSLVRDSHLVIFVHGYEGCSFDMKLIKNTFAFLAGKHVYSHSITANETDTTSDIDLLGRKLAEEVKELIKFNFKDEQLKR
jgi:hypothetical protein